jgi:peptidoglycan-associated lipoprotein
MGKLSLAVVLGFASGCAHKIESKKDTTSPASEARKVDHAAVAAPAPSACANDLDLDCGARQLCIRQRCVDITAGMAECGLLRVHFPLNSAELEPDDKNALERSARCLKADQAMHVSIEGNADERGTEEYNLALGDRRATAVARYLEALGVSQAQLKPVSYGKENPLCADHDEACWSKNRRVAVKPAELAHSAKHVR